MRHEKSGRQTLGAICAAYCDHADDAVYSKERPIPLEGAAAGRLNHDRQAGVPHRGATVCFGQPGPPGARGQAPRPDAPRAPAGRPGSAATVLNAGTLQDHLSRTAGGARDGTATPAPDMALGQRRRR
jgi:hypothetical protein